MITSSIPTKIITIRNNDRPWLNNEIRKDIRIRDRFRKTVLLFYFVYQLYGNFEKTIAFNSDPFDIETPT